MVKTSKENFIQNGRDFVLAAMDAYIRELTESDRARGWLDKDLPALIPALDAHFSAVAARFADPESEEVGSANIRFEND